ncbi:aldolase [Spongiactinospora sp. TRM90649]|uniref:DUF6986 family protein n=1 Tax=Spongiactinospora sp. TRM90649 TaxID=3031114 RepID=UPI0023FA1341|nr:aldolase [Spongiactinospora sp. TRM90649]MDF5753977.1 aldolase [Spongiactinospora sp. TRM90649]
MRVTLTDPAALIPGFARAYAEQRAGERAAREPAWQPSHTVYVPADAFGPETAARWAATASALLAAYLRSPGALAGVFEVDSPALAAEVHRRVVAKLSGGRTVEDLRIDFEDGYGERAPDEEDAHAEAAARSVAEMHAAGTLPRRWGLRVKSFADGDPGRAVRTLDGFLTTLTTLAGGLPRGFRVTFPKVVMEEYLGQFATCLSALEEGLGLPPGALPLEMQVEDPRTLPFLRPGLVETARGRLAAAHFGVFDYTAACGLAPHEQRLDHPACDHARHAMLAAFAGTSVELADGSLAAAPASESASDVRALWRRHAEVVRHSLAHGYYQGWDMHPAHLVSRFVTTYAFHLEHRDRYASRVAAFVERRATGDGALDEPATVRTLTAALARAGHALGD